MTPTEEQILQRLGEIKKELSDLRLCVTGDKIQRIPGILDVLDIHRKELYGDKETKHEGLKDKLVDASVRLTSLEGDRTKLYWLSAGVSAAVVGAWQAAKAWFSKP